MPERDLLSELSSAVAAYLRTVGAAGECLSKACPEVGIPYRKRLAQLRTRLSFEPKREAIQDSVKVVEAELEDFAVIAAEHFDRQALEYRRALLRLEEVVESMARSCDDGASRLREVAIRLETANPGDAAELRRHVEAMNREKESALDRLGEELNTAEERLRGAQSTDPTTGLLNSREMTRQIEAHRASGVPFSLLSFELAGVVGEQVMRQAAARIDKQFRSRDRVARWGEREFLVLFQGPRETAETRAAQVTQTLGGAYLLESGASVDIAVHTRLTHPDLAVA